jgi:hypothetical protein
MAIVAAMLAVVATAAFAMFTWAVPPTAVYVSEQFGTADSAPFDPQPWESVGGSWKAAAGTYDNTLPAATAVSTIFEYKNLDPVGESTDAVPSTCTYGSRMLNRGVAATQLIGVVYNYHDVANYYEAVFSPTGTMLVRRVLAGTMTTVVTTNYLGGAQNVWFEVQIIRDRGTTTIKVNGITVLSNLLQTCEVRRRICRQSVRPAAVQGQLFERPETERLRLGDEQHGVDYGRRHLQQ